MSNASSTSIREDSLVNDVRIIIQPNPSTPTPVEQTATSVLSQGIYGVQSIVITGSLLATDADAELLAEYLLRPDPNFWFTGLEVVMGALTDAQRNTVSTLDIGSVVTVVKSFQYGTPSTVSKTLFVEGIEHTITSKSHNVRLYFSPVGFNQEWQNVTANLQWQNAQTGLSWGNLIWTTL